MGSGGGSMEGLTGKLTLLELGGEGGMVGIVPGTRTSAHGLWRECCMLGLRSSR